MVAIDSETLVLIVEDDTDTADMLRRLFVKRRLGTDRIQAVGDVPAALEFLHQATPRCMIIDERLPGLSGLDLLRLIRAQPEFQDVAIFFYSAIYDWRKQMEAEALGAHWYVKGVSRITDLILQVARICGYDENV